jgi:hypothetical protein
MRDVFGLVRTTLKQQYRIRVELLDGRMDELLGFGLQVERALVVLHAPRWRRAPPPESAAPATIAPITTRP